MLNADFQRVDAVLIAQARDIPASIFSDVMGRRGALDGAIQPLAAGTRLCGPAFTVSVRPGDNLMIHAALVLAQPGDILVIDGQGGTRSALLGELMASHAQAAGLGGIVVDGAVRDTAWLRDCGLPVYARASNPNGPTRGLAGQIGHPVSIGGTPVAPGALIVGDDDGVLAIAQDQVEQAIGAAQRKSQAEDKRRRDIAEGRLIYDWLEPALRQTGVLPDGQSLNDCIAAFRQAARTP